MGIIAGLDLGNGPKTKLIRTNFLITQVSGSSDSQALANMLSLVNNRLPKLMKCDYIMSRNNNINVPNGAPANSTEHTNVALGVNAGNLALMGPSSASLAIRTTLGVGSTRQGAINEVQSGKVIMLTGLGAVKIQASASLDRFDVYSTIELTGQTNDEAQLDTCNSLLLAKQVISGQAGAGAGSSASVNLSIPINNSMSGFDAPSSIDYTDAALTTNFIPEGNQAGTTPTTFTSLGAVIDDKFFGILSVTALVETSR